MCILGRSGSGKSTLCRIVLGSLRPNSGQVLHGNVDITSKNPVERKFTIVSEEYGFIEDLNIMDNLLIAASEPKQQHAMLALARKMSVDHLLHRKIADVSLGQKHRLLMVRALCTEPELVILDETLSSLDSLTKQTVLKLFIEHAREKQVTCIIASHQVEDAFFFNGKLLVMCSGQQKQFGNTVDVYNSPQDYSVAKLTGKATKIKFSIKDNKLFIGKNTLVNLADDTAVKKCKRLLDAGVKELIVRPSKVRMHSAGMPPSVIPISGRVIYSKSYGEYFMNKISFAKDEFFYSITLDRLLGNDMKKFYVPIQ